jgi:flagellar biosynthetic protein FliR
MGVLELGITRVEVFLLVLSRTAGIFTLVPVFGSGQVPVQVRLVVSLALAMVFTPLAVGGVDTDGIPAADVPGMLLFVAKETLVGLAIGFVTTLVFAAIQAAGDLIDLHAGFAFATIFDPMYGTQAAIAGRFHQLLAGMLFFVTNAHHMLLLGLADSFRIVPVGGVLIAPGSPQVMMGMFAGLLAVAIKIAAPIVVAVFLADVALAVMARIVPQMNVFVVGLPLKLGVGLVGLIVAAPTGIALARDAFGEMYQYTTVLLRILAGG